MDSYERANTVSDQDYDWMVRNDYLLVKGQLKAAAFLETFVTYPSSQPPAGFSVEGARKSVNERIKVLKSAKRPGGD